MIVKRRQFVSFCAAASAGLAPFRAMAQGRSFKGLDLNGKDFSGQNLPGADFSGTSLREAKFDSANIKGANFRAADLQGAFFTGAMASDADFRDITGPMISSSRSGDFSRVNMEGADLRRSSFYGNSFRGANLKNTTGWWSIAQCNFRDADVRGANFLAAFDQGESMRPDFSGATYDKTTAWPAWFDLEKSRAKPAD